MTTAFGCSRPTDLVRLLTGADETEANRFVRVSKLVHRVRGITDGAFLPARYPALRAALIDGEISVAGFVAAVGPLEHARRRISEDDRLTADAQLAALARGLDPDDRADAEPDAEPVADVDADADADADVDSDAERDAGGGRGPRALPEDLGVFARVIVAYLDPDGAEPSAQQDAQGRFLRIGKPRNGVHAIHAALLPEPAAQLMLLLDSILNPRVDAPADPTRVDGTGEGCDAGSGADESSTGVGFEASGPEDLAFDHAPEDPSFRDLRTRPQKLHDAFAMILNAAAASTLMPTIGGAPPTLVVTATATDITQGTGWASVLNTGDPIPLSSALQTGCAGGIQRILFDPNGRVVSIGTSARIFNALQRRAIMARDGGCVIPGCTVPAMWCEVHHVREHADGGPTHTDNGVLLCWWHHRTLHLTEWTIRIRDGLPEVRGPAWWDPHQNWHHPTSPHQHPATLQERR